MHSLSKLKKVAITLSSVLLVICNHVTLAQTRYFQVSSCPESTYNNWRDTSFVVATADTVVINKCLSEIMLPFSLRTLYPSGVALAGNGGYNKNASHCFSWHLKEDEWDLVPLAMEVCDGCAYSDAELLNFSVNPGYYCGWGNRIVKELMNPPNCTASNVEENEIKNSGFKVYPNPTSNILHIYCSIKNSNGFKAVIINQLQEQVYESLIENNSNPINITHLPSGVYVIKLLASDFSIVKRFIKN